MTEKAIDLGWMRWPREESEDEFYEEYRGFNIYLAIPNEGICGGSVIEINSKKKAWVYMNEHLEDPRYTDSEWHVNQCKAKIDSILENRAKRKPQKRKSKQEKAEEIIQLTLDLGI